MRSFRKTTRIDIDFIIFLFVVTLLLYYIYLRLESTLSTFGTESGGGGKGKVLLLMTVTISSYLLWNINILRNTDLTTKLVLLWIPIGFLSSLQPLLTGESFIYVIGTNTDTMFWSFIYLFFFTIIQKRESLLNISVRIFTFMTVFSAVLFEKVSAARNATIERDDFVAQTNEIYYVLTMLPWILSIKNKLIRNSLFLLNIFLVLRSMKRTAMIVVFLCVFSCVFINNLFSKKRSIVKFIVITIIVTYSMVGLFLFIDNQTGGFLVKRIEDASEDGGSGRDQIFEAVWKMQWEDTDVFRWIIGHGYNTVKDYTADGLSAHNDWLEVLFDFGLLGFIIYFLLHLSLIRTILFLLRTRSSFAAPFTVSYIMFFIMSLSSHLMIYPSYIAYIASFWGACYGVMNRAELSVPQKTLTTNQPHLLNNGSVIFFSVVNKQCSELPTLKKKLE